MDISIQLDKFSQIEHIRVTSTQIKLLIPHYGTPWAPFQSNSITTVLTSNNIDEFGFVCTLYTQNHTRCALACLLLLSILFVRFIHTVLSQSFPFHWCMVFLCVNIPHFIHTSAARHSNSAINKCSSMSLFGGIYQKWNCWSMDYGYVWPEQMWQKWLYPFSFPPAAVLLLHNLTNTWIFLPFNCIHSSGCIRISWWF